MSSASALCGHAYLYYNRRVYKLKFMKISFLRHTLLSRGGDKMVLTHAAYLAGHGHEVTIKTNMVDTIFEIYPAISINTLKYKGKIGTLFSAALEKHDADFIIADIIPLACLIYLRNRNKVVYFAQDDNETVYANNLQRFFIRCLYFLGLSVFKIPVIAVSEELAGVLRKRYRARVDVALNGIDTSTFYRDPSNKLLVEKNGRKALLLLSRNDSRKGFDLALRILDLIQDTISVPLEVWTVGERIENNTIHFKHRDFGYVSASVLRSIMSTADVFLYPTRYEGFGLMVLEAFACHCPVVTTEAVPFAQDGVNAMVSTIEDVNSLAGKVREVLENDALSRKLTKNGKEFLEQHPSCNASTDQFYKALQRLTVRND